MSYFFCLFGVFVGFFFFFKQKTAYEMRISDWSSDVCSSDLHVSCSLAAIVARRANARRLRFHHQPVLRERIMAEDPALEDPHLNVAHALSGVRRRFGVIHIRAQRVERPAAPEIPFGTRELGTAATAPTG